MGMTTENLGRMRHGVKAGLGNGCGVRFARYTPRPFSNTDLMSQHRSLKGSSTISAKRNVLKRFERVELLKKRSQFKAGDKLMGLRKTKPEA